MLSHSFSLCNACNINVFVVSTKAYSRLGFDLLVAIVYQQCGSAIGGCLEFSLKFKYVILFVKANYAQHD